MAEWKLRGAPRLPLAGTVSPAGVITSAGSSSIYIDFTAQSVQDPVSIGGTWSSNSVGVGGNGPAIGGTDARIVVSSDGTTKILGPSAAAHVNYEDSFGFIPGVIGGLLTGPNYRVTATIFRAAGYAPADNHEVEILFGCKAGDYPSGGALNYHRWNECLWSTNGNQYTIDQNGNFSSGSFVNFGISTGLLSGGPDDLDQMVAELYLSANRIRWGRIRSGTTTWANDTTNATYIDAATLGDGIGLGFFRRPGDTNALAFGFRDVLIESFT